MKLYLKRLFQFSLGLLFLAVSFRYIAISNNKALHEILLEYQIKKIENTPDFKTILVGDSSLGNAIDAKYFTELSKQKTINCALNGSYGYAGSYNMIKAAHKKNPKLKNVIVVQTLDMQERKISYTGYYNSSCSTADFLELNFKERIAYIEAYVNYVKEVVFISDESRGNISEYDYIKQKTNKKPKKAVETLKVKNITSNKNLFLIKIVTFCKENNINLVYAHGPRYDQDVIASEDYINKINTIIESTGIEILKETPMIEYNQIGDAKDHVSPEYKRNFTAKYFDLIKPYLK